MPTTLEELEDLPEWVWELIEVIQEYDHNHPPLYRQDLEDGFTRTECPCQKVLEIIPEEAQVVATINRRRRTRKENQ